MAVRGNIEVANVEIWSEVGQLALGAGVRLMSQRFLC